MWGFLFSGAAAGLGLFLILSWWLRWELFTSQNTPWLRRGVARIRRVSRRTWSLAAIGVVAGLVVWAVWRWPIAVVAVPVAVVGLPALLSNRGEADRIARLEALEEWTRNLASVLTLGSGLEQALVTSLRSTPPAISGAVGRLVARIGSRWDTVSAVRAFADDLDDQVGDRVSMYLVQAASSRGTGLSTVLHALAQTVADEVRARRQIEADRAGPRATARWVTIISAGVLGTLAVLGGDYLAPYRSPGGQILLVLLVGGYLAGLVWLKRIAAGTPPTRSLGERVRRDAAQAGAALLIDDDAVAATRRSAP
ncbi:type II secretion system F family protein [Myceligenerans crystallogenes]|uniref:Type II secretion system protein GspF domain-containing protein n=1 Tax=Myceligenerans crystallogenes TaxID=316335 RepID=A0ABN2NNF3_9MICO